MKRSKKSQIGQIKKPQNRVVRKGDKKVLRGKTVLITRAPAENELTRRWFVKAGAEVVAWSAYEYQAVPLKSFIRNHLRTLSDFDWIVFTSVRAVHFFLESYLELTNDFRHPASLRVAAVGNVTAKALREAGFKVHLIPKEKTSLGLAREKTFSRSKGLKIFVPQSEDARQDFFCALEKKHRIVPAVFYRKKKLRRLKTEKEDLLQRQIDWIVFFSPSAVDELVHFLGRVNARRLFRKSRLAVIGNTTAKHLSVKKLISRPVEIVARQADVKKLLIQIKNHPV